MKISIAAWAAIALTLSGCHPAKDAQSSPPTAGAGAALGVPTASTGPDPLAAAKDPAGADAAGAEAQAAEDVEDNARSRALAPQLAAHPDWLARQRAICGPGDQALQARYAARQGPPSPELRALKVACIAKDLVDRGEAGPVATPGAAPGVKNTQSL